MVHLVCFAQSLTVTNAVSMVNAQNVWEIQCQQEENASNAKLTTVNIVLNKISADLALLDIIKICRQLEIMINAQSVHIRAIIAIQMETAKVVSCLTVKSLFLQVVFVFFVQIQTAMHAQILIQAHALRAEQDK